MKPLTIFAAFAAVAVTPAVVSAQNVAPAAKAPVVLQESVGVVAPKVSPAVDTKARNLGYKLQLDAFTQALENRLTDALARTRKFKVVTRGDLDTVIKEQDLAASGNLDANDPQIAQRFKLAGAKYVLLVTVDDYQDRVDTFDSAALGQRISRRTIRAGAAAKLLETTGGVVKESVSIPVVTQDDVRNLLSQLGNSADSTDAIAPELARLVADRIAQRLVDARFPAKVMAKSADGVVTFNRGDGSGVQIGQEWGVYAVGDALVDPDTGESLGAEEVLIARAVVTDVEAKFSKAKLVKDQGVAAGAVMRPMAIRPVTREEPAAQAQAQSPAAQQPPPSLGAPKKEVTLILDKDRKLTLDGREITPDTASAEFAKLSGFKVVLRADGSAPSESVDKVLNALRAAGASDVSVSK